MKNPLGLSRQALNPLTSTLIREKQREAEDKVGGGNVNDQGGRKWSHAAVRERTPTATRSRKRQRTEGSPLEPQMSAAWLTP